MVESVKSSNVPQQNIPPDDTVGATDDVDKTKGPQPETGAGNIDVTGIKVSRQGDKVIVELKLDAHDIDDVPGVDPNKLGDSASLFMEFDAQQGLDLIGLMGKVTDELRHSLASIKSSVHATEMEVRQDQYDASIDAADDEKKLGATAFWFSVGEGASQMTIGAVTTGISMNSGTSDAEIRQAQTKAQAFGQIGGGLTAPLGGVQKMVEGNIRAHQQHRQAAAQFLGSLLQDLNPQSLHDAIKEVQQYYGQNADKTGQAYGILMGNMKMS